MAFIISKKSVRNGNVNELYYLVENHREDKRIKRKTLLALKKYKTVAELLDSTLQEYASITNKLHRFEKDLDDLIRHDKKPRFSFGDSSIIKRSIEKLIEHKKADIEVCQMKIDRIKRYVVPEIK